MKSKRVINAVMVGLALLWNITAAMAQLTTGTIDFNVDDLHSMQQITIELSDGSTLELHRDEIVDVDHISYSWVGRVRDHHGSKVVITVVKPNATGTIQTLQKVWKISIPSGALDPVQEIQSSSFPAEVEPLSDKLLLHSFESGPSPVVPTIHVECEDPPAEVRVLVLYSNEAAIASPNIDLDIRHAITMANQSFKDSGIVPTSSSGRELTLHVIATSEVDVDEPDINLQDLQGNGDGFLDNIHSIREQVKADLVTLLVENFEKAGTPHCGEAYLDPGLESRGFSIVSRNCIHNHSFTHEIAHNFGAKHDKYVLGSYNPAATNYGFVHLDPMGVSARTLMAAPEECVDNSLSCQRLGVFSSPDNFLFDNVPAGTASERNRREIAQSAEEISCYRSGPPNVQTVYFEGTVWETGPPGFEVPGFNVGDVFWGTYRLQRDVPDSFPDDPTVGNFEAAASEIQVHIGSYEISVAPTRVQTGNDYGTLGHDYYTIYNFDVVGPPVGRWEPVDFRISMVDPTGTAFNSDVMPNVPPWPADFVHGGTYLSLAFNVPDEERISFVSATFEVHRVY